MKPDDLAQLLRTLQVIAVVFSILSVAGPIAIAALLWKASKFFASKDELTTEKNERTDHLSILDQKFSDFMLNKRETDVKLDLALSRLDKFEEGIKVELKYIRRDLDQLLNRKLGTGDKS
jgi:hypothetical protein